jgi:hypothetical protein
MRAMSFRARRVAAAMAALAVLAGVMLRASDAQARPRKAYWLVSFLGGVLTPLGKTADQRELGLGVGLRVGYTARIGLGVALSAQYSPLPVADPDPADGEADVVTENHFVAATLVPRFTLGRGALRLSIGAGGGGIMERTSSRPAGDEGASANAVSVFAAAAAGEVGIETYLWESGGLVLSGSYLRSFGERESEVAALLAGLVFTFR